MFPRMLVAMLALAAAGSASAAEVNVDCRVNSPYSLGVTERSVIYTRTTGTPHRVVIRDGHLFVDDAWVQLDAEDSRRIVDYEREVRAMLPDFQRVAAQASDIAFTTLQDVADAMSSHPDRTRKTLADAHQRLDAALAVSINAQRFDSDAIGKDIEKAIEQVMPDVTGDLVGGVLKAVFTGDHARLDRIDRIGDQIDAKVEARAQALERDAQALCVRMETLDRIENGLHYRGADGKPLELLKLDARAADGQTTAMRDR